MVYHTIPFNHKGLMGIIGIVGFGRFHQVRPFPIGPMDQVIRAGKTVIGMPVAIPESAEIKKNI